MVKRFTALLRCAGVALLFFALPAQAADSEPIRVFTDADCPSTPWPTTQFKVIHRTTPFDIAGWLDRLVDGALLDDELQGDLAMADEAWSRLIETQLHDIATRMEAAGLGCPNLGRYLVDGEEKYLVYLIDMEDDWFHGFDTAGGLAYSTLPLVPYMLINRDQYNREAQSHSERVYEVLAHELFHMVQGAYERRYDSIRMVRHFGEGQEAVVEGGAEGAATWLLAQRHPGFFYGTEYRRDSLGGFAYTDQYFLDAPPHGDDAGGSETWRLSPYSTSSFWRHAIERYGGLALKDYMLRTPISGRGINRRTRWLEHGLSAPLDRVFPHFIAELASYGWGRYRGVDRDDWLDWTLDACRSDTSHYRPGAPVSVTLDADSDWRDVPTMPAITARCVPASWSVDADDERMRNVLLQVEAEAPTEDAIQQVQAGLAHASLANRNCWKRMAALSPVERRRETCELRADGLPLEVDGRWRQTWTLPPGNYETQGEAWITLTNVAANAPATEPVGGLRVRFRFLEEYAEMGTGEGAADIPAAALDQPLPIELDNLRSRHLFPVPPSMAKVPTTGDEPVCAIRFFFTNKRYKDGVSLAMDHIGPIGPGDYSITPDAGPFLTPDERPNAFVVSFGLGKDNPLAQGNRADYWGRVGTVTLTRVTPALVQGHFSAVGERTEKGKWERNGYRDYPRELNELPVTARFSVIPQVPANARAYLPVEDCMVGSPGGRARGAGAQRSPTGSAPPGSTGEPPIEPPAPSDVPGSAPGRPSSPGADPGASPADAATGSDATADGADSVNEVPAGALGVLFLEGAVEERVVFENPATLTGGCNGTSVVNFGMHTGELRTETWRYLSFTSAETVGTGATGTFTLRELVLDHGVTRPSNLPADTPIRVPDRYTGTGTLTIDTHNTAAANRRMTGRLSGTVTQRGGAEISLTGRFSIPMSCGTRP